MCGDEFEEILTSAGATTPPARGTPINWGNNTATSFSERGNCDDSENACKRLRREEAITFSATDETSEQFRNCGLKRMGILAADTGDDMGDTSPPAGMWEASCDENQTGDGAGRTKHGAAINKRSSISSMCGVAGGDDSTEKPAGATEEHEQTSQDANQEGRSIPAKPANWATMTKTQRSNWYKRKY